MKHQTPITKSQGNSKPKIAKRRTRPPSLRYSAIANASPLVQERHPNRDGAPRHPFDLEERTTVFGEDIVRFSKKIPRDPTNNPLIGQLVGCGTSIGANYCEADERVSKKDFRNTIGRCVKEAKETKYFLRMVVASEPNLAHQGRELFREARELHLIFASIYRKGLE